MNKYMFIIDKSKDHIGTVKLFGLKDSFYQYISESKPISPSITSIAKASFVFYDKELYNLINEKGVLMLKEPVFINQERVSLYIEDNIAILFIAYEELKCKLYNKKLSPIESARMLENIQFITLLQSNDLVTLTNRINSIVVAYAL
jgi:hypothetical protein